MEVLSGIIFVISCMGLWFLLMPASLYGILGSVLVLAAACVWAYKKKGWQKKWTKKPSVFYLLPIGLLCWVMAQRFYERWRLSGTVAGIAGWFGVESGTLLVFLGVLGALASLPMLVWAAGWVRHAANEQREVPVIKYGIGKITWQDVLFFLLFSLCMGLLLALNPWSDVYPGADSTVFLYIGQQMRQGAVPYRDLFDHKGLLLYFIEYLGICIGNGSSWGVWVIEIANIFVTALLMLRITQFFCEKKLVQYAVVALVLGMMECYQAYEGGNLTEEYALPWITLALYIFLKYFIKNSYRFIEIVLLGISFTAVLFLRANMVAVWAAFLPVVLVMLILQKKWGDIGKCIVGFLLGIAVGMLPFIGYCMATGSLSDMIRYYISFNFGYSDSEGGLVPLLATIWFLLRQTAIWMAALFAGLILFWKNRIWRLNLWYLAVSLVLASMSGRLYYHYGMILLPAMLVPVAMLAKRAGESLKDGKERYLTLVAGAFFVIQAVVSIAGYTEPEKTEISEYIMENTDKTDDVLVLGNVCRYYLESGRTYAGKFFYQTPPANVSDEIYEEVAEELQREQPKLIVLPGGKESLKASESNMAGIYSILEKWRKDGLYTYTELDSNGFYQRTEK